MPSQFETQLQDFRSKFEELIHAIEQRKVVFFVGAGISRYSPTDIDTAKELSQKFKEKFGNYPWWQEYFDKSRLTHKQQIKRLYTNSNDLPKLEEIADLFLSRTDFNQFIDTVVENGRWQTVPPNVCHIVLSELLIEEICSGVITANQDDRIETKHREITHPGIAPNIIFHDDFRQHWRQNNNVFKIHGCLSSCPTRKYQSVWATSKFTGSAWPSGVTFAHEVLMHFGRGIYKIVFVGFSTHLQYLENTINEILRNGGNVNQFYCVSRRSLNEIISQQGNEKFASSIQLQNGRHCQMDAETFFQIVRYIAFENLLNDLCRDNTYLKGDEFKGGSIGYLKIALAEFQGVKELLKKDVLSRDRENFQKFLQLILLEKNSQNKYVSFRYKGDHIAQLFFMLALLRFNYTLVFCQARYRHLLIKKNDNEISLIIINGGRRSPLHAILQKVNDDIGKDYEMTRDVKNIFVYNTLDDTLPADVSPGSLKTGRVIEAERPIGTISNASDYNYHLLHENQLRGFLSVSATLEEFNRKLDQLPWNL